MVRLDWRVLAQLIIGIDFIDFSDDAPNTSQATNAVSVSAPTDSTVHDRHSWIDQLSLRYNSGRSVASTSNAGDEARAFSKQLLERIYSDPFIYIVLLYCKVGNIHSRQ